MIATTKDLKGQLRRRELFGRIDFACCACLAVVPDPDAGCQWCKRTTEKKTPTKEPSEPSQGGLF